MQIAVDMMSHAVRDTYDTAVLVSGDGDLAPAVEEVTNLGKHVENAYFLAGHSRQLRYASHKFVALTAESLSGCLL